MRCIFVVAMLAIRFSATAQTTEPERQTLQALLVEVQQLRAAIERSTLLGTRTQIAMQRIQMQEARTTRLSQDLDRVRREVTDLDRMKTETAVHLRAMEAQLSQATDPNGRLRLEEEVKRVKIRLEQLAVEEPHTRAREADLANQVQAEQSRLTELQDRVSAMERVLDTAIGNLTGQR
jgi:hypothetical protein